MSCGGSAAEPTKRMLEGSVDELAVERTVADQEPEEERTVEEVEHDLDVEVAPKLSLTDRLIEKIAALFAAGEDEVVAKRFRKLRLGIGGGDYGCHVTSGRAREALHDGGELLP